MADINRRYSISEYPRRKKKSKIFRRTNGIPLGGAGISALLLCQAWVRQNHWTIPGLSTAFCSVSLLDSGPAVALLSGFVTLAFVRSQFVYSSTPIFDYRISRVEESKTEGAKDIYRIIDLHNVGQGVGIVTRARYWLEFKNLNDSPTAMTYLAWFQQRSDTYGDPDRYQLDFRQLKQELESHNFRENETWSGINFGNGSAFGAGSERQVMKLSEHLAQSLVSLDARITYESVLGDVEVMEIYMVPRRQF